MYVDGTLAGTAAGTSSSTILGNAGDLNIGRQESASAGTNYLNGYMDEVRISSSARYTGNFTPKARGETFTADSNTMLLIHSDWEGGLGADSSGNYNTFTATNLVATDQMKDSPTNNFCTGNPLFRSNSPVANQTYSEGNLKLMASGAYSYAFGVSNFAPPSGKWYCEVSGITDNQISIGAWKLSDLAANAYYNATTQYRWFGNNGVVYNGSSGTVVTYNTWTTGDVIGIALDLDNNKLYFAKNGTWENSGNPATGTNPVATDITDEWVIGIAPASGAADGAIFNFGQDSSFAGNETAQGNTDSNGVGDFYYEPPSGFLALCSDNLPSPEIADPTAHMNTVTYAGTGASQTIAVGFQPDLVWAKSRNTAVNNVLYDSVRGTGRLESNTTNAEGSRDGFAGFDSNGFDVDDDGGGGSINYPSGRTYVAWNWKGGGTAVTNDDGSIDSEVSANTTAGFSIVSYTGTGSTTTIGHGLSQAPEFLVVKNRTTGSTAWQCGSDFIVHATPWSRYITLSSVAAETNSTQMWNDTAPTSSVFTVEDAGDVNTNTDEYIAYCFHSVEGYSKVGSYTGNGDNDGTFVYTGFRPMWVMAKVADQSGSWLMTDSVRFPYIVTEDPLFANESSAETNSSTYAIDIVSNGFKCRGVNNNTNNSSNDTYIYLAFAESPFKTANAR